MNVQEVIQLYRRLSFAYSNFYGSCGWNGLKENTNDFGLSNTYSAGLQFVFALALSKHQRVREISNAVGMNNPIPMQELEDSQVLNSLKIIDLGCGTPSFARLSRWLGANLYTVDVIPSDYFTFEPCFWDYTKQKELLKEYPQRLRDEEARKHIMCDLNEKGSIEKIISNAGDDFDLVTEANIANGIEYFGKDIRFLRAEDIASILLKEDGVLFSTGGYSRVQLKSKGRLCVET